jgi:uncharacterized protein YdaU (DUF1376 family)
MSLPWYACYPRDFNDGMIGLTLEERGAYITLLNLIYSRGGPIPEDAWWITSQLGCTTRVWTKVRAALLVKRKLFEVEIGGEPHLMNARADREIGERRENSKKFSEAGRKGGQNSRPKLREINARSEARLQPGLSEAEASTQSQSQSHSSEANASGDEPPIDLDRKAWANAKAVLVGQAGLSMDEAGKVFGRILAQNKLEARDMLGAIGEAEANGTHDPVGLLTRWAQSRNKRRQPTGPPKRVGWV